MKKKTDHKHFSNLPAKKNKNNKENRENSLLQIINKKIFYDFNIKIICFFLAIIMYFIIGISQRHEKSFSVDLKVTGLKDYFIISNTIPKTLKILAKDKQSVLDKITEDDFNVKLDLSHINTADVYFEKLQWDIPKNMKSFFSSIKVMPDTLKIVIEHQTERIVPIIVDYIGEVQPGFILKRTIVNPPEVRIRGPKKLLTDQLKHIKTRQISIKGEKESFTSTISLIQPASNVVILGSNKVEVTFDINVETDLQVLSIRKILTHNLNKQFRAAFQKIPITVKVSGPKRKVAAIKNDDITLSVDCADLVYPGQYTKEIRAIISNEEIKLISITPRMIKIDIMDRE